jgi:hypothetical protein
VRKLQNASVITSFPAGVHRATDDEKAAFENLVQAAVLLTLAKEQPDFGADEGLVCGVILQIVSEFLADSKRIAIASEFLQPFPSERVKAMRDLFSVAKKKSN